MPSPPRIPRLFTDFNGYINRTASYLFEGDHTPNYERLRISHDDAVAWRNFAEQWNPRYAMYCDKRCGRTTAIRTELVTIMKETISFDRKFHFLDRIGSSPSVTIADVELFNIRKGLLQKRRYTIPNTPISEPVSVRLQPIGGGSVKIKCFSSTAKRAAIYKPADCVHYCYCIGDTPPVSPEEDWMKQDMSTKASIILATGVHNHGKKLHIYLRWYCSKHPKLAGPWSSLQTTLIL